MSRGQAIAIVILLGGALLVGAALVLPAQAPPEAEVAPTGAQHVTLYQNGLAFVTRNLTFESEGGETRLTFAVPAAARLGSLVVESEDVTVREVRAPLHGSSALQPGDRLVVHAQDSTSFAGTLLRAEGDLHLATEDGSVLVPREKVVAIELVGADGNATAPGTVQASVLVDAPAGRHDMSVSYLAQGAGWTPSYRLDADTGRLVLHATLAGLAGWEGVRLDLVSGSPHLVSGGVPMPAPTAAMVAEATDVASREATRFTPAADLGVLHRFSLDGPVDLPAGEQVRLTVLEGNVSVARAYHEVEAFLDAFGTAAQPLPVRERLELRNTLNETLPAGVVLAYREGVWVGEDQLAATPPGEAANVTLATVEDVTARLVRENATTREGVEVATHAIHVENHGDEPADVRVVANYPPEQTRLVDADPAPVEQLGGRVAWDATVAAGDEAAFRLMLERERPPERVI